MKSIIGSIVFALILLSGGMSIAQDINYSGGEPGTTLYEIPPRFLVDAPTAGTLPRGSFTIDMRVYDNGGFLAATAVGLSSRFMVGISYGVEGLISEGDTHENPRIEFHVKLRLIDESRLLPAFAIGFNSQGYGAFRDDLDRYTYKSKGFYGVISRSFIFEDVTMGSHAGINYSLENDVDEDKEPTVFVGFDARFRYNIGFFAEYDLALNDDRSSVGYAKGRGYLNLGLSWNYTENLQLEFILRNLLQNRHEREGEDLTIGRELRLTYIEFF